jgi:hypothetical protein
VEEQVLSMSKTLSLIPGTAGRKEGRKEKRKEGRKEKKKERRKEGSIEHHVFCRCNSKT